MTIRRSCAVAVPVAFALVLASGASAGDPAAGKKVYDVNCASCHGPDGKADGPLGQALKPPPRNFAAGEFKFDADKSGTPGEDADLTLVIQKGALNFGGSPLMAAWPTLDDAQIADVIAYIRSLKE
jgi:mono/diheme cytochrome c family protein